MVIMVVVIMFGGVLLGLAAVPRARAAAPPVRESMADVVFGVHGVGTGEAGAAGAAGAGWVAAIQPFARQQPLAAGRLELSPGADYFMDDVTWPQWLAALAALRQPAPPGFARFAPPPAAPAAPAWAQDPTVWERRAATGPDGPPAAAVTQHAGAVLLPASPVGGLLLHKAAPYAPARAAVVRAWALARRDMDDDDRFARQWLWEVVVCYHRPGAARALCARLRVAADLTQPDPRAWRLATLDARAEGVLDEGALLLLRA